MTTEGSGSRGNIADRVVDDYSGFKVYDERGEKLGKVEYTVLDHDEQPQYLGVNTGFFGTKTTLIPEELVRLDDSDRSFSAQTSESKVKDAPTLDSHGDISSDYEGRIRDHYRLGSVSSHSNDTGHHDHSREESRHGDRHHEDSHREDRPRDDVRSERSDSSAASGAAAGGAASSMDRETRTETRDVRDAGSDHPRTSRRPSDGGDREQVRVTLKREKARAERVVGEDGEEEVRIRKTTVREETLVDVEDTE